MHRQNSSRCPSAPTISTRWLRFLYRSQKITTTRKRKESIAIMNRSRIIPIVRKVLLGLLLLLIASQFYPVDRTNSPVDPSKSFYTTEKVPPNLRAIFDRSCTDCHSSQTHWPWYSHVAPVSWIVANDVHEARHHVNFSEWEKRRRQKA